jgi:rod shape-determining protein MreD
VETISHLTRRELDSSRRFNVLVLVLVPAMAILFQASAPLRIPVLRYLDLPLLVTIFFSVARRSPIAGSFTGAIIGTVQDALAKQPVGIFGVANTVCGYIASSLGMKLEIESVGTRLIMIFGFKLLHDAIAFVLQSHIVGTADLIYRGRVEIYTAIANAIVGVILFSFLDRLKQKS